LSTIYDAPEIINEFNSKYNDAYAAWNPFYPLAERDLRFYLGDQWESSEKKKLSKDGRNTFTFNLVRKNINMILGYHIQHQLSPVVLPREDADQQSADDLTELLLHAFDTGEGYKAINDAFGGALKTGFNLLTVWMDYRDDPVNGDIRFGREPYSGFITDPYFTKLDFSDCGYVIRRKYLSVDQATSLLPDKEGEIKELDEIGWNRDDKFPWLPYQRNESGVRFIAYDEFYQQKWKQVPLIVDEETGESMSWDGSAKDLKVFLDEFPQLTKVMKSERHVECHILVNNTYMKTEINQFGLDEYPFVPFVGIFESEADSWDLKIQSLVRPQVDPQKESNRRRSQMIDILDSQINSGWIADEDAVVNPKSLYRTSQGKVIWRTQDSRPGSIEKISPSQIPPSMFALQRQFDADILSAVGLNDASFGQTQNDQESGIMMMLRQSASLVNIQDIMENVRFAQKQVAKKCIKMMQKWTPEKTQRIINRQPTEQFYSDDFVKHDISIQEGLLTGTQKQIYFRQLLDLKATGAPVSGMMLAKAAPLQGGSKYLKELQEEEESQAQQAQQAQKLELELLEGKRQSEQAKAISDVALSKERFTRAIANIGLSDERAAQAVDDRASAALDRAKAVKELSSLDDEKLLKYLGVVRSMEEMGKAEEQQIKTEDVAIAAQGQKIGNEIAGGGPSSAEQALEDNISQEQAPL